MRYWSWILIATFVISGTVGCNIPVRFTSVPDETDGSWKFTGNEVKTSILDASGDWMAYWETRYYTNGKLSLAVHRIFGETIMKAWGSQRLGSEFTPADHTIALLIDGRWHIQRTSKPIIVEEYDETKYLRGVKISLKNERGEIVASRYIPRPL